MSGWARSESPHCIQWIVLLFPYRVPVQGDSNVETRKYCTEFGHRFVESCTDRRASSLIVPTSSLARSWADALCVGPWVPDLSSRSGVGEGGSLGGGTGGVTGESAESDGDLDSWNGYDCLENTMFRNCDWIAMIGYRIRISR